MLQVQQVTVHPAVSVTFYMAGGVSLNIEDDAGLSLQQSSSTGAI